VISGTASIATNTWSVPADGGGTPKELSAGTWSTVTVPG
jgi:hypothetical protein